MQRQLTLERTVYLREQFTPTPLPQIAMAGRSNVGKSSLINCLGSRKQLAKTSSTPGKTRSINYYHVTPGNFYLVDLPGYGYARTSKAERAKWAQLIEYYLTRTPNLTAVAVLLDARHPPQKIDTELTNWLENMHIPLIPILTKADKTKQGDRNRTGLAWKELLHLQAPPVAVSGKTGMHREKLWHILEAAATNT